MKWHILTPEFPPDAGGVSDYTFQLAAELVKRGHTVHIWCSGLDKPTAADPVGVQVHRRPDLWGIRGLLRLGIAIRQSDPGVLLIQYSPYGFGLRGVNVLFPVWLLWWASRTPRVVQVMFHEFAVPFRLRLKTAMVAVAQRLMAAAIIQTANRIWVSVPAMERHIRRFGFRKRPVEWLPVFSNIPVMTNWDRIHNIRRELVPLGELLVGHFGTYPSPVGDMVVNLLPKVLHDMPRIRLLLIGRGSHSLRETVLATTPNHASRVVAVGSLPPAEVSAHLAACDLCFQPYPEGVTSRRTTMMACLAHARPVVTTIGPISEPLWTHSAAVELARASSPSQIVEAVRRLVFDPETRTRLGIAGEAMYKQYFDLDSVIDRLERACES